MTNTFDESLHPRSTTGKFAAKATAAPSGSLAPQGAPDLAALRAASKVRREAARLASIDAERVDANERARQTALDIMTVVPDAVGISTDGSTPDIDNVRTSIHLRDGRTATWDGAGDDPITLELDDGTTRSLPASGGDYIMDAQFVLSEMGYTRNPNLKGGVTEGGAGHILTWNERGEVPNQPKSTTVSTIPARERVKAATTHLREAVAQHDRLRMEIVRESAVAIDPLATKLSFRTVYGDDGLGIEGGFWLHRADGRLSEYFYDEVTHFDRDGNATSTEPVDHEMFEDVYDNLLAITEPETIGEWAQVDLPRGFPNESRREISLAD